MAILSKISRAFSAYLISAKCGSKDDILQFRGVSQKGLPNTVVDFATTGTAEPENMQNTRVTVAITIRSSATSGNGSDNPDAPWILHNQRIDAHYSALTQANEGDEDLELTRKLINQAARSLAVDQSNGTDPDAAQFAANNADMENFTINEYHYVGVGLGREDEDGTYFEDVLMFSVLACENNVD